MPNGPTIAAKLGLDVKGFKTELANASGAVRQHAAEMRRASGDVNILTRAHNALAKGLAGIGLAASIKSVVEYGSQVQDLSDRFGVSASTLQRFGNAAELAGSSLEAVGKAFRFLEVNREKALSGNEGILKAFQELGVSIENLRSLSPEEIMLKIGSSSLNAADLVKVLGKSALDLRPILAGLADGTTQFGNAMSDVDVAKLKEADDRMKELKQSVTILIGSGLVDFFEFVEAAAAGAGGRIEAIQIGIKGLIDTLAQFSPDLKNLNPVVALEKFKEIQRIADQVKKDQADANERGSEAAADTILERREKREEERKKKRNFAKAVATEESEAGATDDQGRAVGKSEGKRLEKAGRATDTEQSAPPEDPFARLTIREALRKKSVLDNDAAEASKRAHPPGGPIAGVGESQEKVDEIERNRRAAEAQNKLVDAAQESPDEVARRREEAVYRERGLAPESPTASADPNRRLYDPKEAVYRERGLNPLEFGKDRASDLKAGVGETNEKAHTDLRQAAKDLQAAAEKLDKALTNQ
jgi:hypothetical protein